jgi:hypothetical protein
MKRKKTSLRSSKPIGFTKVKGSYRLVYRKNNKPVLGKRSFKTKTTMNNTVRKMFKK